MYGFFWKVAPINKPFLWFKVNRTSAGGDRFARSPSRTLPPAARGKPPCNPPASIPALCGFNPFAASRHSPFAKVNAGRSASGIRQLSFRLRLKADLPPEPHKGGKAYLYFSTHMTEQTGITPASSTLDSLLHSHGIPYNRLGNVIILDVSGQ